MYETKFHFSLWTPGRPIDESLRESDRQVPSHVKWVSGQARAVACEVQRAGVVDAAKNITKTMYTTDEPTARGCTISMNQ